MENKFGTAVFGDSRYGDRGEGKLTLREISNISETIIKSITHPLSINESIDVIVNLSRSDSFNLSINESQAIVGATSKLADIFMSVDENSNFDSEMIYRGGNYVLGEEEESLNKSNIQSNDDRLIALNESIDMMVDISLEDGCNVTVTGDINSINADLLSQDIEELFMSNIEDNSVKFNRSDSHVVKVNNVQDVIDYFTKNGLLDVSLGNDSSADSYYTKLSSNDLMNVNILDPATTHIPFSRNDSLGVIQQVYPYFGDIGYGNGVYGQYWEEGALLYEENSISHYSFKLENLKTFLIGITEESNSWFIRNESLKPILSYTISSFSNFILERDLTTSLEENSTLYNKIVSTDILNTSIGKSSNLKALLLDDDSINLNLINPVEIYDFSNSIDNLMVNGIISEDDSDIVIEYKYTEGIVGAKYGKVRFGNAKYGSQYNGLLFLNEILELFIVLNDQDKINLNLIEGISLFNKDITQDNLSVNINNQNETFNKIHTEDIIQVNMSEVINETVNYKDYVENFQLYLSEDIKINSMSSKIDNLYISLLNSLNLKSYLEKNDLIDCILNSVIESSNILFSEDCLGALEEMNPYYGKLRFGRGVYGSYYKRYIMQMDNDRIFKFILERNDNLFVKVGKLTEDLISNLEKNDLLGLDIIDPDTSFSSILNEDNLIVNIEDNSINQKTKISSSDYINVNIGFEKNINDISISNDEIKVNLDELYNLESPAQIAKITTNLNYIDNIKVKSVEKENIDLENKDIVDIKEEENNIYFIDIIEEGIGKIINIMEIQDIIYSDNEDVLNIINEDLKSRSISKELSLNMDYIKVIDMTEVSIMKKETNSEKIQR